MNDGHRLALPDGGGLKRQLEEQDMKIAGQYLALLQNVFKTCVPRLPALFICNILSDTPTSTPRSSSSWSTSTRCGPRTLLTSCARLVCLRGHVMRCACYFRGITRACCLQSIGAMANASRRQQDTMVTKSTHWSHVTPHTSHLTPHTSHLTPHTSQHTPRASHLTPHTPHLTPHTSHLTPHTQQVSKSKHWSAVRLAPGSDPSSELVRACA